MESIDNSTIAQITTFLKRQPKGATFVHTDFYKFGSCSNVRTVLVRLCERNQLVSLCQGVYMKPGAPEPDTLHIAKEIATEEGYSDFELTLSPTADFWTLLMSRGSAIKILQPQWLADEIKRLHLEAAKLYE